MKCISWATTLCHRSLAQQSTLTVRSKSGHCTVCIVVTIALSNPWRNAIGSFSHKHLSQLVADGIGHHLCSQHAEQAHGQRHWRPFSQALIEHLDLMHSQSKTFSVMVELLEIGQRSTALMYILTAESESEYLYSLQRRGLYC